MTIKCTTRLVRLVQLLLACGAITASCASPDPRPAASEFESESRDRSEPQDAEAADTFESDESDEFGGSYESDGESDESDETDSFSYGDDPILDELWDDCDLGDYWSCDQLYGLSPIDSDYEYLGATCGFRTDVACDGLCEDEAGEDGRSESPSPSDDDPRSPIPHKPPDTCDEHGAQHPSDS